MNGKGWRRVGWVVLGLGLGGLALWAVVASLPWGVEWFVREQLQNRVDPNAEFEIVGIGLRKAGFKRLVMGDEETGWRVEAGPGWVSYHPAELVGEQRAEGVVLERASVRIHLPEADLGKGKPKTGGASGEAGWELTGIVDNLPLDFAEVKDLSVSLWRGETLFELGGFLRGQTTPRGWEQVLSLKEEALGLEARFLGHLDFEVATWIATGEVSATELRGGFESFSDGLPTVWQGFTPWLPERIELEAQVRGRGRRVEQLSGLFSAGPARVTLGGVILDWAGFAGGGILKGANLEEGSFRVHGLLNSLEVGNGLESASMAVELFRTRDRKLRAQAGPFELRWAEGGIAGQLQLEAPWPTWDGEGGDFGVSPLNWNLQSESAELSGFSLGPLSGGGLFAPDRANLLLNELLEAMPDGGTAAWLAFAESHFSGSAEAELASLRKEGLLEAEGLKLKVDLKEGADGDGELVGEASVEMGIAEALFLEGVRASARVSVAEEQDWESLVRLGEGLGGGIRSQLEMLTKLPAGQAAIGMETASLPGLWDGESVALQADWAGNASPIKLQAGVEGFQYGGMTLRNLNVDGTFGATGGIAQVWADLPGISTDGLSLDYAEASEQVGWNWTAILSRTTMKDSPIAGLFDSSLKSIRLGGEISAAFEGGFADRENWQGKGRVLLKGVRSSAAEGKLELDGLNGSIRFRTIHPLATEAGQLLRVSRLEAGGFVASGIQCLFELSEGGAIRVSSFQADVFGGRIRAEAFTYQPVQPDVRITLHLERVQLAELQKQIKDFPGTMEGRVNGVLRLTWDGRDVGVGRGFLELTPGTTGQLRLNLDGKASSLDSPAYDFVKNIAQTQTAVETLRSVEVREARFDLFNEENANNPNQLVLRGISRSIQPATPVDLTVNLREDVEEVLAQALKFFLSQP